jgi:hypothetical protein
MRFKRRRTTLKNGVQRIYKIKRGRKQIHSPCHDHRWFEIKRRFQPRITNASKCPRAAPSCLTDDRVMPRRGWILTRSAPPWGARAHQGKIDFSFPLRRLPLQFEMRRRLRGKEKQVGFKALGCCTSRQNPPRLERNQCYCTNFFGRTRTVWLCR